MMREVKFRGKRLGTDEWVYGGIEFQSQIGDVRICVDVGGIESVLVDPATVGQYTGMKDRKGIEIYEGDLVRYKIPPNWITDRVWYSEEWAVWYKGNFQNLSSYRKTTEVVGNIYDNPELLKGGR